MASTWTGQGEHFEYGIKDIWPFFIKVTLLVKSFENDVKIFGHFNLLFENNVKEKLEVGWKKPKYNYVWLFVIKKGGYKW